MTTTPSHREIVSALVELTGKVDSLVERIGHEHTDERGNISGTGLTGRIIRTEAKVLAYDRLKAQAAAVLATASLFIGVLWWLTKEKWAHLFGVTAS